MTGNVIYYGQLPVVALPCGVYFVVSGDEICKIMINDTLVVTKIKNGAKIHFGSIFYFSDICIYFYWCPEKNEEISQIANK